MSTHLDYVRAMHILFDFEYNGEPRPLPEKECVFRLKAFAEEIEEYADAVEANDLPEQLDALIDLYIFLLGAVEQHGFSSIFDQAFGRVMDANVAKTRVLNEGESKRKHSKDLIKPEGWWPPYTQDLFEVNPITGLIILDGPDGTGKTTLANHFVENYNAHYMHLTWSPELDKRMDSYSRQAFELALQISQNKLVVVDRLIFSELVYAEVYRDGSKILSHSSMLYNTIVEMPSAVQTIMCLPSNKDKYIKSFNALKEEREEMYSEKMDEIYAAYTALWLGNPGYHAFPKSNTNMFVDRLLTDGLMRVDNCFTRYDYTHDGREEKMPLFGHKILQRLNKGLKQ